MTGVLSGVKCRECGKRTLHLRWHAGGTVALRDGVVTRSEWPWCVCYSCGTERPGLPQSDDEDTDSVDDRQNFYDRVFPSD